MINLVILLLPLLLFGVWWFLRKNKKAIQQEKAWPPPPEKKPMSKIQLCQFLTLHFHNFGSFTLEQKIPTGEGQPIWKVIKTKNEKSLLIAIEIARIWAVKLREKFGVGVIVVVEYRGKKVEACMGVDIMDINFPKQLIEQALKEANYESNSSDQ